MLLVEVGGAKFDAFAVAAGKCALNASKKPIDRTNRVISTKYDDDLVQLY
jgi:hypothetical protein